MVGLAGPRSVVSSATYDPEIPGSNLRSDHLPSCRLILLLLLIQKEPFLSSRQKFVHLILVYRIESLSLPMNSLVS